jgi:hypothetical protein
MIGRISIILMKGGAPANHMKRKKRQTGLSPSAFFELKRGGAQTREFQLMANSHAKDLIVK